MDSLVNYCLQKLFILYILNNKTRVLWRHPDFLLTRLLGTKQWLRERTRDLDLEGNTNFSFVGVVITLSSVPILRHTIPELFNP